MLGSGSIINERYEVLDEIGHGGMSVVFRVRDRVSGKVLAVKEAKRNGTVDDHTAEYSLAAEGQLLKNLSNPHIPRIYDIIESELYCCIQ